jgi:HK97 family phage major capsid protein
MSRLAALREERASTADKAKALNEKYPPGARMPVAETRELDKLLARVEAIDAEIRQEGHLAERASDHVFTSANVWTVDGSPVRAMRTPADFRAHYSRSGVSGTARSEVTLHEFVRGVAGMQTSQAVRAALLEGTDSAGGFLVPSLVMPQVLEALVPASAVLTAGATILPLEMGAKSFTLTAVDNVPSLTRCSAPYWPSPRAWLSTSKSAASCWPMRSTCRKP